MKIKKNAVVLGAFVLGLMLAAGCGQKNTNTIDKNTVYKETPIDLTFPEGAEISSVDVDDNMLYFSGYLYDEVNYTNKTFWGSSNLDGSNLQLNYFDDEDSWINELVPMGDGSMALFYSNYESYTDENEFTEYTSNYMLSIYEADGTLLKSVNLSDDYEISYVDSVKKLSDGSMILFCSPDVYEFDKDLNLVNKHSGSDGIYYDNFFILKDGTAAVSYYGNDGEVFDRFDLDTLEIGEEIETAISFTNYTLMDGTGSGYDILLRDNTQIYGYNMTDTAATPIMNFINSDCVTASFDKLACLDDGSFIGSYYDWYSDDNGYKVSRFTKVAPEDVVEKELISIGCLYLDSTVRKDVVDFNKSNSQYRIVITDYSTYNTEDNYDAGLEKMNSDIASGQAPDIIVASDGSSLRNYMSKGVFLDLTKYLEEDTEVDVNDILPNVLSAWSYNDKVYEVSSSFCVTSLVAKTSMLNGMTSWNFDEMTAYEASLPEGTELFPGVTRENMIDTLLSVNADSLVDYNKSTCYFDTPYFTGMLEFLKTLPEGTEDYYNTLYTDDYWNDYDTQWRSNKVVLNQMYLSELSDYKYLLRGTFGEDITFIGYPCEDGNGSTIDFNTCYAISSKCANPQAAWDFIKRYINACKDDDFWGIPVLSSVLDEKTEELTRKSYYMDGDNKVEYDDTYYIGGQEVVAEPLTQEEAQKIKDFICSVTKVSGNLSELSTIITEEAAPFFEGQKTVDDVAKIIQSRASIYINEKQ